MHSIKACGYYEKIDQPYKNDSTKRFYQNTQLSRLKTSKVQRLTSSKQLCLFSLSKNIYSVTSYSIQKLVRLCKNMIFCFL